MTFDPTKNLPGGFEGKVAAFILKRLPKEAFVVDERREKFPNEPWLWEIENINATRLPETAQHVQFGWAIAFFLNSFAWLPAAMAYSNKLFVQYPWSQALLILPIVAPVTIPWAIHRTLQAKIFSKAQLNLDHFPVASGTTLDGTISIPTALRLGDRVKLTLTCHEAITTGSGKSESTRTKALWTNTKTLPWDRDEHTATSQIPVHFELPQEMEGTTEPDTLFKTNARKIYWTLLVTAAIRGINLRALFKLPIYRTPDSPPLATPDFTHTTWQSMDATLSGSGIYHTETALGRHVLKTQVPRSFSPLFSAAIMFGIFGLFVYNMWDQSEFFFHWRIYISVVFFSMIAGVIRSLLFAVHIEVSREGLELKAGTIGFRRARVYTPDDIASLPIGYEASSGKRCDIHLHTVQGQETVLLRGLPNRAVAEELIARIMATLQIPSTDAVSNP